MYTEGSSTTINPAYQAALDSMIGRVSQAYSTEQPAFTGHDVYRRFGTFPYAGPGPRGSAGMQAQELAQDRGTWAPHIQSAVEGIGRATTAFPESREAYMNPYQREVVDRIGELGNRNLQERLLPALEAKFIRQGQHGGSRHAQLATQLARDVNAETLGQQRQALQEGYKQSADIHQADRMHQLEGARLSSALAQSVQAGRMTDLQALRQQEELEHDFLQKTRDYQQWQDAQTHQNQFERLNQWSSLLRGVPYSSTTSGWENVPNAPRAMHGSDWGRMGLGLGLQAAGGGFPNLFG
jgi:hypothetical protein